MGLGGKRYLPSICEQFLVRLCGVWGGLRGALCRTGASCLAWYISLGCILGDLCGGLFLGSTRISVDGFCSGGLLGPGLCPKLWFLAQNQADFKRVINWHTSVLDFV